MRRIFAVLSTLFLFCLLITGCLSHSAVALTPNGPQQAQLDNDMSVALVSDFGPKDRKHQAFCSGVWVSPTTIMTAGHCVAGYAQMKRHILIVQALLDEGLPPLFAMLLSNMDVDDVDPNDPELSPEMRHIVQVIRAIPHFPIIGLDIPYIVPGEVVDVGVAPLGYQHTTAVYVDLKADVALLKVYGYVPPHLSATLAEHAPLVGESVTMVGNIHTQFFSFRRAVISAYRHSMRADGMKTIDGPFMQLSGSLMGPGDSGSGIFDSQGRLVGIGSFIGTETNFTYCIHLETLRGIMIGQHLLKAKIDVTAKDPDLKDVPLNSE